jgi:hypothetical protein
MADATPTIVMPSRTAPLLLEALRWLIVVPAWYGAVIGGMVCGLLLQGAVDAQCPASQLISGSCVAWWAPFAHAVALSVGTAAGAALAVLLPVAAAPRWRFPVAVIAFCLGAAFASAMTSFGLAGDAVPYAVALVSGLAVLARVRAGTRRGPARP